MGEIVWLPFEKGGVTENEDGSFGDWVDRTELLPGYLVKDFKGNVELVGHVNDNMGSCDCCSSSPEFYSTSLYDTITAMIPPSIDPNAPEVDPPNTVDFTTQDA